VAILGALALSGCCGEYAVEVSFVDGDVTEAEVSSIEVYVVDVCPDPETFDGSVADPLRRVEFRLGEPAPSLGDVPEGRYGLLAVARGPGCGMVGHGCEMHDFEACGEGTRRVEVQRRAGPACPPPTECIAGACRAPDSGLPDGGRDTGVDGAFPRTDAGTDAGGPVVITGPPSVDEAVRFGRTGNDRYVAVDAAGGDVYLTGGSREGSGNTLVYFARYPSDLSGTPTELTYTSAAAWGHQIETSDSGQIRMSGHVTGASSIDPGGVIGGFMLAVDRDGTPQWGVGSSLFKRSADYIAGCGHQVGFATAIGPDDATYIYDHYDSRPFLREVAMGGGTTDYQPRDPTARSLLVARYSPSGTRNYVLNSTEDGLATNSEASDLTVVGTDDVVWVGHSTDEAFVSHRTGPAIVRQTFGDASHAMRFLSVESHDGRLVVAGYLTGSFAKDGVTFGVAGERSLFLIAMDVTFTLHWAVSFPGDFPGPTVCGGSDGPISMDIDAGGNIHIAAAYRGSLNIGGTTLDAGGGIFLAGFDSAGDQLYARPMGGGAFVGVHQDSLDAGPDGSLYLAGMFSSDVTFGGQVLNVQGGSDIFLLRLRFP